MIKKINLLIISILFSLSCFIYLTIRDNIILFKYIENPFETYKIDFPDWIIYNLPDGIWMLSLTYTLLLIWNYKIKKSNIIWFFSALIIALLLEYGQKFDLIYGTYDNMDVLFIVIGFLLPIINFTKIKHYEKKIN